MGMFDLQLYKACDHQERIPFGAQMQLRGLHLNGRDHGSVKQGICRDCVVGICNASLRRHQDFLGSHEAAEERFRSLDGRLENRDFFQGRASSTWESVQIPLVHQKPISVV